MPQTGWIVVADMMNNRVVMVTTDGAVVSTFGSDGSELGQLRHPADVAIAGSYVVVSEWTGQRLQLFTLMGAAVRIIDTRGSKECYGVCYDEARQRILAVDRDVVGWSEYGLDGETLQRFSAADMSCPLHRPCGIGVNSLGHVIISDAERNCLHKFDPSGTWLGQLIQGHTPAFDEDTSSQTGPVVMRSPPTIEGLDHAPGARVSTNIARAKELEAFPEERYLRAGRIFAFPCLFDVAHSAVLVSCILSNSVEWITDLDATFSRRRLLLGAFVCTRARDRYERDGMTLPTVPFMDASEARCDARGHACQLLEAEAGEEEPDDVTAVPTDAVGIPHGPSSAADAAPTVAGGALAVRAARPAVASSPGAGPLPAAQGRRSHSSSRPSSVGHGDAAGGEGDTGAGHTGASSPTSLPPVPGASPRRQGESAHAAGFGAASSPSFGSPPARRSPEPGGPDSHPRASAHAPPASSPKLPAMTTSSRFTARPAVAPGSASIHGSSSAPSHAGHGARAPGSPQRHIAGSLSADAALGGVPVGPEALRLLQGLQQRGFLIRQPPRGHPMPPPQGHHPGPGWSAAGPPPWWSHHPGAHPPAGMHPGALPQGHGWPPHPATTASDHSGRVPPGSDGSLAFAHGAAGASLPAGLPHVSRAGPPHHVPWQQSAGSFQPGPHPHAVGAGQPHPSGPASSQPRQGHADPHRAHAGGYPVAPGWPTR